MAKKPGERPEIHFRPEHNSRLWLEVIVTIDTGSGRAHQTAFRVDEKPIAGLPSAAIEEFMKRHGWKRSKVVVGPRHDGHDRAKCYWAEFVRDSKRCWIVDNLVPLDVAQGVVQQQTWKRLPENAAQPQPADSVRFYQPKGEPNQWLTLGVVDRWGRPRIDGTADDESFVMAWELIEKCD